MKLKQLATDIRAYLFLIGLVIAIVFGVSTYAKLPEKVEKNKENTKENTVDIQTLTNNVDKFIAVQHSQDKAQERREELLLKLIEEMNK